MSKEFMTPIEIYYQNDNLKNWFLKNEIVWKYEDWKIFIPTFWVEYEKDKKTIKNNNFPFYHNMFEELIISLEWDWKLAMEMFKRWNSYISNWWTTIILQGKFI